tara:strand:- start:1073 stop:1462 length:390 start_codon:yes stop_codon:yes gene_type:complete
MSSKECKLKTMFDMRLDFIKEMKETIKGSYPEFPLDISQKDSQQVCRDLVLKGVEEMFEALQHLKNWKPHRQTDLSSEVIDKDEFLEEIIDAFNYFFAMLIVTGFDENDLFDAFLMKHKKINDRLRDGY